MPHRGTGTTNTYGMRIDNQTGSTNNWGLYIDGLSMNNFIEGNLGIGTNTPGAKLEVAGQVKITGGTPGAGKVLTSDAAGLATWETGTPGPTGPTGATGAIGPTGATGPVGTTPIYEMGFILDGPAGGGTTSFLAPGIQSASSIEEHFGMITGPVTAARLVVYANTAPGGAETVTVTVRQNGSDKLMAVTLTGATQTDNDLVNSFSVLGGDRISIKVVTSAGSVAADISVGLRFRSP